MKDARCTTSSRGSLGIWAWIALALAACAPTEREPLEGPRTTSLLRLVDEQKSTAEEAHRTPVWALGGDYQPVLAQPAPSQIELGPIAPGRDCRLRFGMGVNERAWHDTDGVDFIVRIRRGSDAAAETVFEELLIPGEEIAWTDREVKVEGVDASPFSLIFETGPGPSKKRFKDHAGWASPHVVCKALIDAPARPERPHILLVSVDTLRRDRLGLYGYEGGASPNLDALARESVVFENLYAQGSYTTPTHGSMFTGLYPEEHGAGHHAHDAPLHEDAETMAEILAGAGYRTAAVTAGGMLSHRWGFAQGFEEWIERQRGSLGAALVDVFDLLGRLDDRPLFLFLHTYDVHGPYIDETRSTEAPSEPDADWQQLLEVPYHEYQKLHRFHGADEVSAAYDAGITVADGRLGELFEHLRSLGLYDDMLVIVTSDHGESLFEQERYFGHGFTLHDAEVRIPLIVRVPGARTTGRREDFVEQIDLLPLVLGVAGVDSGLDLSGADPLRDTETPKAIVRGETSQTGARYARSESWKVIAPVNVAWDKKQERFLGWEDRFETGWQVYDLAEDPRERHNLFSPERQYPPEVRRLFRALREAGEPGLRGGEPSVVDDELAETLKALGYL